MATINVGDRRIDAKIVYYGPSLSGKTTNLLNIHQRLPEASRGAMRSIETQGERTLFFDLIPLSDIRLGGWTLRYHLYSVPGQAAYVRTRRAILGGADGVVFVADADPAQAEANIASRDELRIHLAQLGRDETTLPIVLQINKIDLPDARPDVVVNGSINTAAWPLIPASAINGVGVAETLGMVVKAVAQAL